MSVKVIIDMGYDDYDGVDQQTPSRMEFPDHDSAEHAVQIARRYLRQNYPHCCHHFNVWIDKPGVPASDPESVISLIEEMAKNYDAD